MKIFLSLICILVFVFVLKAQSDIKLEIGEKLPRKYLSSKQYTSTAASNLRPFVGKTINKVSYIIAFDKETCEIRYIHTRDKDFQTINGLRVGSEVTFTRQQLIIFPYWEIRLSATPDGWFPVIAVDMSKLSGNFIGKLKDGEKATMTISGFSKGSN